MLHGLDGVYVSHGCSSRSVRLPDDACGCPVGLATRKAAAKARCARRIRGERARARGLRARLRSARHLDIRRARRPPLVAPGRMPPAGGRPAGVV